MNQRPLLAGQGLQSLILRPRLHNRSLDMLLPTNGCHILSVDTSTVTLQLGVIIPLWSGRVD
jgi:hypothetical protein